MSERLFIGLWPGAAVQDALARWRDAYAWPQGAALVPDAKLHVTLHFLGDVAVEKIDALGDALAIPFSPFTLDIGLPAMWHGGIAVLEPTTLPDVLLALHATLGDALDRVGLIREQRVYRPHVTLARRAAGAVPPEQAHAVAWPVDGFALMASRNGRYEVLRAYRAGQ